MTAHHTTTAGSSTASSRPKDAHDPADRAAARSAGEAVPAAPLFHPRTRPPYYRAALTDLLHARPELRAVPLGDVIETTGRWNA